MINVSERQRIVIDTLFETYKSKGYINEDETLTLMVEQSLSLVEQEQAMDQLLAMGVLLHNAQDDFDDFNDEEQYDRSRTYYEEIFSQVIEIDPGLTDFIEAVRQIQAPQHREWMKLMPQAKAGYSYAVKRIVEMYLRNVIRIALFYQNNALFYNNISDIPLADKIQEGVIGLMIAIEKFEHGKNRGTFLTYAPWWIKQTIRRSIDNQSRIIRLPTHTFEAIKMLTRRSYKLAQELGHEPLPEDLAADSVLSVKKVAELLMLSQEPVSLSMSNDDEESLHLVDFIPEDELTDGGGFAHALFESVSHDALSKALDKALDTLKPKEKEILMLRNGIGVDDPMTLEEIGQIYNVTRERIRQIEAKALRKLSHPSRSECLKDFLQ